MGNRHRAFFRIVVSDSRRTPTSSALEEIGYYDPKKQPVVVKVNLESYDGWMKQGAQPSNTVRRLVMKARAEGNGGSETVAGQPAASEAAA
jgi:small subunit ribosomal protein S16